MSAKTTLILVLVLVALCVAYWAMVESEDKGRVRQREKQRLFSFTPDDIAAVEIRRIGEQPAAAKRADGSWAFTKPNTTIQANDVLWERVARAGAELVNERTIDPSPEDLAAYGLDKPVLAVTITEAGEKAVELTFGVIEPTQTFRYARADDGPVFLVSAEAFHEFDRPLELLRYPYVVTVGEEGVTRLEFSRFWKDAAEEGDASKARAVGEESLVVAVERGADGQWRLVSPVDAQADQEAVNELVKEIQYARGRNYIDAPENLEDYGLDPPGARITVYCGKAGKPQTILVGSLESPPDDDDKRKRGGIFAKRASRPAVFVIDSHILALLPKTPDAFRQSRLLTHKAVDIQSIHYASREEEFTLDNDTERGWRMVEPEAAETDQETVSNFIGALKTLRGRGFPGEARPRFGLEDSAISIRFSFKDGSPPAAIRVGAQVPDTGQYYATQDTGVVTLIGDLELSVLTRTAFDFKSKALMKFDSKQAARVSLKFEGVGYLFEKTRGIWQIKAPPEKSFGSQSDIEALIAALSDTRAVALQTEETPADLAQYGLDAPLATITLTTLDSATPPKETTFGPLDIGKTAPDESQQRFATVEGRDGIYRVKQAIIDDIRETLKGVSGF